MGRTQGSWGRRRIEPEFCGCGSTADTRCEQCDRALCPFCVDKGLCPQCSEDEQR